MKHLALLFAAAAALGLAACGDGAQQQAAAPVARPESCDDPAARVPIGYVANAPEWIQLSPQAGGGYTYWGKSSIRRCGEDEARAWVQVRYANEQLWGQEGAAYNEIIRYTLARFHYRFNCTDMTYATVEMQIIGANEEIVATAPGRPEEYTETGASPAGQIINTACFGS
ncbi:MAG: hypothetical protein GC206_11210 [Alphaproteobacteria bacterium]|nr:hypothetical protein [Alphaproteobacteria bacterium]